MSASVSDSSAFLGLQSLRRGVDRVIEMLMIRSRWIEQQPDLVCASTSRWTFSSKHRLRR